MEETVNYFVLILFVVFTLSGLIFISYHILRLSVLFAVFRMFGYNPFRYIDFNQKTISFVQETILLKHFDYYKQMPPQLRNIFKNRLAKFMETKKFESRQKLVLTEEIKTLVSACAVQLTFGLSDYYLAHFDRILIYPEAYYSRITKKFHKGEVNARGLVVLSWEDFKEGYSKPNDNINLGLHEFAHALFINYQKNKSMCISFDFYYDLWREIGDKEFFKMRKSEQNYLRQYGATNLMEFFSVSVEHFFEAPNAFKKALPDLYSVMSKFLAQDPARWMKA